jgi:DNA adenine methylase
LIAIRDYVYELPGQITEDYYKRIKGTEPDPITSWLRFVCSYGGKFEGGFARQGNPLKYRSEPIEEGIRNAQKQSAKLQGVKFIHGSYDEYSDFENCLIYCDPPYKGVTSYKTGDFDHHKFWQWCRNMSLKNVVFTSEYEAPDDFICVWRGTIKTNFASQRDGATSEALEKLFRYTKPEKEN